MLGSTGLAPVPFGIELWLLLGISDGKGLAVRHLHFAVPKNVLAWWWSMRLPRGPPVRVRQQHALHFLGNFVFRSEHLLAPSPTRASTAMKCCY